jgi:polysaccharide biosynthesis/export protein ExoF
MHRRLSPQLASSGSRGGPGRLLLRLALVLAALLGLGAPVRAADTGYRLGPQDKVRIRVWEWRPATSEPFEWSALNGDFAVDPSGMLSVPLIGPVRAEGATTAEIATNVAEKLKAVAGLMKAPNAAVEIAQYRPFYIVGSVDKPGEYPYRPGMTVIQAITIAGGYYRPEVSLSRFDREAIIAQGDIKVSEAQRIALVMKRDRLEAESRGDQSVTFSDEVLQRQGETLVAQGMREETMIFATRRQSLQAQIDLLVQANGLLEEELRTLGAKSATQLKQNELARRELDNINSLMNRGLAVSGRQLAVEQNVAQMESMMLDLSLAAARTRQDMSRNQRNIAELRNQRANEVLKELRETQVNLDQVMERLSTYQGLLYESQVTAPQQQLQRADAAMRLEFHILRRQDGNLNEIAAEAAAPVLPGDIIRVQRPLQVRTSNAPPDTALARARASGATD